jgi:hypothetical protein
MFFFDARVLTFVERREKKDKEAMPEAKVREITGMKSTKSLLRRAEEIRSAGEPAVRPC